MSRVPYTKAALSNAAHLQQLKARGLKVEDQSKAEHILRNISYFRLSGYWYPMLKSPKSAHQFKPGSTFNNAFKIYCFDRELRQLVLSELEKIEVAIRAQMINVLSLNHGPFWFNNYTLFQDRNRLNSSKGKLRNEFNRSDEEFILAFKQKYSDPLPPSWMSMEIASFGTLSNLYSNLNPGRDRRQIANYFGLNDTTFESWLHSFNYIRNICAHHARLWNKTLGIRPQNPRNPRNSFLSSNIINNPQSGGVHMLTKSPFYILSMLLYILNTVNPKHTFQKKLKWLFLKYPNIDVEAMGFPTNWKTDSFWAWNKRSKISWISRFYLKIN